MREDGRRNGKGGIMRLYSQKLKSIFSKKKKKKKRKELKRRSKLEGDSINRETFKSLHRDTINQRI